MLLGNPFTKKNDANVKKIDADADALVPSNYPPSIVHFLAPSYIIKNKY
jgi:hypothetical protein